MASKSQVKPQHWAQTTLHVIYLIVSVYYSLRCWNLNEIGEVHENWHKMLTCP